MEQVYIYVVLVVFGAGFGSFAGASVWRLRARQLKEDKEQGEPVDKEEYKRLAPLAEAQLSSDRSRCLGCGHTLAWYDLLPFISWLSTAGRCRYCKQPIGLFEPLMEFGVAATFVLSYTLWPMELSDGIGVASFALWLVAVVMLAILFAYDLKWFLLPDVVTLPLVAVGLLFSTLHLLVADSALDLLLSLGGAVVILSGLYYLLWLASKGRWVGFGDVKLGLALALFLLDWRLALVALFSANLIGSLVVLPGMIMGRIGRKSPVPFGPFLIAGAVVAMLVGNVVVESYLSLSF